MIVTRFAPSPNGPLHLGHAYSAIRAHDRAKQDGGRFLLRIEDIDGARSRTEHAASARRDLDWLGLDWEDVPAQSTRIGRYEEAIARLLHEGWLYPCTCTRAEIHALEPRMGPQGAIYPGTCKGVRLDPGQPAALRLDVDKALAAHPELTWHDERAGEQAVALREIGDVVIARKDLPASYHLAATLDDAADGISHVVRGADLFGATHVHRMLQALLDLPTPIYHHHGLLMDGEGKLAKRRGSPSLTDRRNAGESGPLLASHLRLHRFPDDIAFADPTSEQP